MTQLDLARATWRKSSYSALQTSECVEVGHVGGAIAVRDSKDPDGPVLVLEAAQWRSLLGALKDV
jgi:hypothetical protein